MLTALFNIRFIMTNSMVQDPCWEAESSLHCSKEQYTGAPPPRTALVPVLILILCVFKIQLSIILPSPPKSK